MLRSSPSDNLPPVLTNNAVVEYSAAVQPPGSRALRRRLWSSAWTKPPKRWTRWSRDLRRVVLNVNTLTNFSIAVNNMRTVSEQAMDTMSGVNALVATNAPQVSLAVSNVLFLFAGVDADG